MAGWKWKAGDGSSSGLLYEPGNWGDILKNEWLLQSLDFLSEQQSGQELSLLDPFAGQPVYPLAEGARRRLEMLPGLMLHNAMGYFSGQSLWPCASLLAVDFCGDGLSVDVFDVDETRRAKLGKEEAFTLLEGESGWDVLEHNAQPYSLVLVDPYDVLQEWRQWLSAVLKVASMSPVLVYIYNRSGRGKERLRDYRAFCSEARASGLWCCLGRVAADAFLPDCWHEMLLLLPQDFLTQEKTDLLKQRLSASVKSICKAIESTVMFEDF